MSTTSLPWRRGETQDDQFMFVDAMGRYCGSVQIHQTPRFLGRYDEERRRLCGDFILNAVNSHAALAASHAELLAAAKEYLRINSRESYCDGSQYNTRSRRQRGETDAITSRDFPAYFHADPAQPMRERWRLPDVCPHWVRLAWACSFGLTLGGLFMAACSSLFFPL